MNVGRGLAGHIVAVIAVVLAWLFPTMEGQGPISPTTHIGPGRWGPVFALTALTIMSDVQRVDNDRLGAFDLVGWCIVAFSEYRQGHG